jgi:hypothetical protein
MAKKRRTLAARNRAQREAKRSSAKAQKTRAAKDAAVAKAVLDVEELRQEEAPAVDETPPPVAETADPVVESANPVDGEAPKPKRKQGRQKGYKTAKAEIERQEQIKEAMEYRLMGYTYRQIAEQMQVAPFYKWVAEGLAEITQETAEELRRVMIEQCQQIIQKLMPLMDQTAPRGVLDGILKVQAQQMKLAGMLQGAGLSVSIGKPGSGDSEEDVIVRIKAGAPVLRPDEPVPAQPVL